MGWRSRRHGPFFGVAALAFAGPYYAGVAAALPAAIARKSIPCMPLGSCYVGFAFYVALRNSSRRFDASVGAGGGRPGARGGHFEPGRVKGNLARPFAWGSYLSWRLYPNIKISMDGRYETTYPESTFALNTAFFDRGDWLKLCRSYKVDFVILDMEHDRLRPEDLVAQGYVLIWKQEGNVSALLCLPEHAAALDEAVRNLPPTTIDPLDLKTRPTPLFAKGRARVKTLATLMFAALAASMTLTSNPRACRCRHEWRGWFADSDERLRSAAAATLHGHRIGFQIERALFWER